MNKQTGVSGVILAGGLARRMNKQDKGLVAFKGHAMITYAIQAMVQVVDELIINANRNIEQYQQFNYPVISDASDDFLGPLAGVYAALLACHKDILLVTPCDSPFMTATALRFLLDERQRCAADIAVAFDGERIHPVFMALNSTLKHSLQDYLAQGERKIDRWFDQHHWVKVDFSANPELFSNINTLQQLADFSARE
ncbi:molybdenum cofactor guanylyltransferase [Bathymodiolus japonicus methanotrophic gill symbiont]|uniref:molybdenum cofactor guanylyltransferase MobA n=1 Tax=Bathymodiolus japonicus methanotrophic gill symbiont TaxID=113269 RepID=UPI001B7B006A|nr:molybdenum cofactor guanylyltransferase MobA [Bathymodiolus japonicus methanotrophic gill symbiont]GFO71571.1 molybdenum cofactor guanylyltransferase [Bathymodiolus japonicus methanotrophic gill symbiont]